MHKNILKRAVSTALSLSLVFSLGTVSTKTLSENTVIADAADAAIEDFQLSDITMTDPYCTNAFKKEIEYLLSFDTEKLLAGFRENAGLSTNGAKKYGGWENTNIAGHAIGHYLTALAQAYQKLILSAMISIKK